MNGLQITVCPTMTNPEALTSVDELRKALHQANGDVLSTTIEMAHLQRTVSIFGSTLAALVTSHMTGDTDSIQQTLDALVAAHRPQQHAH